MGEFKDNENAWDEEIGPALWTLIEDQAFEYNHKKEHPHGV